ncbi:MAG: Hint domain-containing protein, partial [Alphaproteobacteria bacterium]|nr:Hint domain-containing protein [Alphaproteobacteria bacterium]
QYFTKFLFALFFVAGLLFAPNAFASTNLAVPFDWQAWWGTLPNNKIPADMHGIKDPINRTVKACSLGKGNYDNIKTFTVDYTGDGNADFILDMAKFLLPNNLSGNCPVKICEPENNKNFCQVILFTTISPTYKFDKKSLLDELDCDNPPEDMSKDKCEKENKKIREENEKIKEKNEYCPLEVCPDRWEQTFQADMTKFVTDWKVISGQDYLDETSREKIYKPYAEQFYTEFINFVLASEGKVAIRDKTKCVNDAVKVMNNKTTTSPCEQFPAILPVYRDENEMNKDRNVVRIETLLDECTETERLIWDNIYKSPTCVKFYQYGAEGDDHVLVDMFYPAEFPPIGNNDDRMTYWRFPGVVIEGVTFIDDVEVNCKELANSAKTPEEKEQLAKGCPWRGSSNEDRIMTSYPSNNADSCKERERLKALKDPRYENFHCVYPQNFESIPGAMALQFTDDDGYFYCKDIYNTSGKEHFLPARTGKELVYFINAVESSQLLNVTTKILGSSTLFNTANKWYNYIINKYGDVKNNSNTCEKKIVGPAALAYKGYWQGEISCYEQECQQSKTLYATRQCMRSTGALENCDSCTDNPDIYLPPINIPSQGFINAQTPPNNIFTGKKALCHFQRTCRNSEFCVKHEFSCLPAEAKILMADGTVKPIVDVNTGDMVMSFKQAEHNAPLKPAKITQLYKTEDQEYMKINNLEITSAHTILLSSGTTIYARNTKVGDKLVTANGEIETVKTIKPKVGKTTVYNLSLEGGDGFVADSIRIMAK